MSNDSQCAGEPFTRWRTYLESVLNVINMHQEKTFKSHNQMLVSYFTKPTVVIPQTSPKTFKYKIGDKVTMDALPNQRRDLAFKYSLNRGSKETDIFVGKKTQNNKYII